MTLSVQKDLNNQLALIQMRIDGKTLVEIAKTLGISVSTASRWNRLFKSDILAVRNRQVENLRNKIMDRYNSYFDFLDSQLERLKTEIGLHKEIAMTYPDLIDYSIKILEAQNRINIFRKYSYKPPDQDFPPEIENPPPEEDSPPEETAAENITSGNTNDGNSKENPSGNMTVTDNSPP